LLGQIIKPSYEAYFLWLELALAFVIPITLLSFKKVRLSPGGLYLASVCTVLGFITNRLNIALIGFETYVGHHYIPKWTEFSVTLMIVAAGFALFGLAVRYLPIFPDVRVPVKERLITTETGPVVATPVLGHAGD
jgi:molybdopterin-containing oxidoreductase family membrane subunit